MVNEYTLRQIGRRQLFQVYTADGTLLGTVLRRKPSHIPAYVWEATGVDPVAIARFGNDHRGEHELQSQAVKALAWDGKGYPFPMPRA